MNKNDQKLQKIYTVVTGLIILTALSVFYSVHLWDSLKYIIYVIVFILVPGMSIYRLIFSKTKSLLQDICVGWVIGFMLEGIIYIVVFYTGIKLFFHFIPVVFIILLIFKIRKDRGLKYYDNPLSLFSSAILMLLVIFVVLLFGIHSFKYNPLPETVKGATYYQDIIFHLGNAAVFKNGLPMQSLRVSGTSLSYAIGSHLHMGVASKITGIELSTIILRLFPMEMLILWVLCLFWAGYAFTKKTTGGILAVLFTFFITSLTGLFQFYFQKGGLNWDIFNNGMLEFPFLSTSLIFGMPVFIVTIMLIAQNIKKKPDENIYHVGILLFFLFICCNFAKATILPNIIMALVFLMVMIFMLKRKVNIFILGLLIMAVAVYFITKPLVQGLYNVKGYVEFKLFDYIYNVRFWELAVDKIDRTFPHYFLRIGKVCIFFFIFFGYFPVAIIGFFTWLLNKGKKVLNNFSDLWFISLFIMPFVLLMSLRQGPAQWYFFAYGSIAFILLSAKGIIIIFNKDQSFNI